MPDQIEQLFTTIKHYAAKSILCEEGDVASKIFLIEKGIARTWFNQDGVQITLQFFFENETVTAFESFMNQTPSKINIELLEDAVVKVLTRKTLMDHLDSNEVVRTWFYKEAVRKLITHTNRLLSLLRNKPFERYRELLEEKPELIDRVPQHYIASYLGITPVSLSRIKNRKISAN